MSHIYYCTILNQNNDELISYKRIDDGSISKQIRKRKKQLLTEKQEDIQSISICAIKKRKKPPCDPLVDPLHCTMFSDG